jgi:hypothetical protein
MQLRLLVAIAALAAMTLASPAPAVLAQSSPVSRPAELRSGTCAAPGDLVMALANLVVSYGDPQGQTTATPVEESGTIVPYTIADLLADNHIVTVLESAEAAETMVACGEIGGTRNPDGTLASGMRGVNGSGLSGIVYFTPNLDFENTLVTILLVNDGSAAAPAEIETEPGSTAH